MTRTAPREPPRPKRSAKFLFSAFAVARMSPDERVAILRQGLSAREVTVVALRMGWSREQMIDVLHFKRATIIRKLRDGAPLTTADSERLLAVTDMIELVQQMVERSADQKGFDSAKWLAQCKCSINPILPVKV